jgi:hypothetical protein
MKKFMNFFRSAWIAFVGDCLALLFFFVVAVDVVLIVWDTSRAEAGLLLFLLLPTLTLFVLNVLTSLLRVLGGDVQIRLRIDRGKSRDVVELQDNAAPSIVRRHDDD